jgi:hypothetical protein
VRIKKRLLGTLFDRTYAAKGFAMLASLAPSVARHGLRISVLALDDWTAKRLEEDPPVPDLGLLTLSEFEKGTALPGIRARRSWREYCWTLASQLSERLLAERGADQVVYLDSDLYFFADPGPVFAMAGEASVAAVPHRFDETHAAYAANGRYNVGWVSFRNDREGQSALTTWSRNVREWCSSENGPFGLGDQGYLDAWPKTYARFRELGHPGIGLGPWSLEDVDVAAGSDGPTVDGLPLFFYHFHEFSEEGRGFRLTNYPLSETEVKVVYRPYVEAYLAARKRQDPQAAGLLDPTRLLYRRRA